MDEESSLASSVFSHLWQQENERIDDVDVRKKADALRSCSAQLHYYKKNVEKNDDNIVSRKTSECLAEYGKLMDAQDGINNCADAILSLLGSSKNESKKWKTSLNANEIMKRYLTVKMDSSTIQEEDLRIFAHHVNTNEEKSPYPFKEERVPSPIIDEHHTAKQRFTDVECTYKQPSFDMMEDDIEMFKENNASSFKHQEPRFPVQEWKQKSFGNDALEGNINRGRGRMNSGRRGQYPWQKFSAGSNSRVESHGREPFPTTNSNFCQGGSSNPNHGSVEKTSFRTASHQLAIDQQKKNQQGRMNSNLYGSSSRSLGVRRVVNAKFVPPVRRPEDEENFGGGEFGKRPSAGNTNRQGDPREDSPYAELMQDERLKNIDPKMVELIMNEIMDNGPPVNWDDIAGLDLAKTTIQEIVVWPMLRPDIFTGLRGPPKGILLFGPPGTGKTMIGKCIACQSGSTFFSISASSLTSKWVGEGEKMVRAMFAVARCHQPAVIFIDEIDSLLTQRSDTEHESSRRIKTEFLVQLDGATSGSEERLLVVGATNRPQELDEAARRRLVKRLYIPLPEAKARQQIVYNLMENQNHSLNEENIQNICQQTDGYSGADMANLCREAALGPIRSISLSDIKHISVDQVRAISVEDFMSALCSIRASVSDKDLQMYEDWNHKFGISARLNS